MYEVEKKSHYLGQILVVVILQVIMLLFRLVEPIQCENLFPGQYSHFINEFIYFGIEFILMICIVAHGSYSLSFKELGITNIKDNLASLIINLLYLAGGIIATYLMSQFSRKVEFDVINMACQVATNFIAIAFLKEVIFRGFLFQALYAFLSKKGIITSLLVAIIGAATYVPTILMTLDQVTTINVMQKLIIPFIFEVYLSLLYYYGRNLWICCIVHAVIITFGAFQQDFIIVSMEGLYMAILLGYLIYKIVKFYQNPTAIEGDETQLNNKDESLEGKQESPLGSLSQEVISEEKVEEPIKPLLREVIEKKMEIQEEDESVPDLFSVLNQPTDIEKDEHIVTLNSKKSPRGTVDSKKEPIIQSEPNYIEHLEKQLGEFDAIYKQVIPTHPPIDILYFKGKTNDALVTNGMRRMTMNTPPELKAYQNIELMMYVDKSFDLSDEGLTRKENSWLVKLLSDMAVYPSVNNSYLGWGHIVGNGENLEAYDKDVKYCGALVYPPINLSDVHFYQYSENNLNVFIYNVMPLYKEELMFIQEQSSDQFINLMATMGIDQTITRNRVNVIRQLKHQGHNR